MSNNYLGFEIFALFYLDELKSSTAEDHQSIALKGVIVRGTDSCTHSGKSNWHGHTMPQGPIKQANESTL